jgi:hypothetical protein
MSVIIVIMLKKTNSGNIELLYFRTEKYVPLTYNAHCGNTRVRVYRQVLPKYITRDCDISNTNLTTT